MALALQHPWEEMMVNIYANLQKRKLLLDMLPTLLRWAPTRVLLPSIAHSNRTRSSSVQKQRKVLFLDQRTERQELALWSTGTSRGPWVGLLYRVPVVGRGEGRGLASGAQARCSQHFRRRCPVRPSWIEVPQAARRHGVHGVGVSMW